MTKMLKHFTMNKHEAYNHFQSIFNKSNFLIHFNAKQFILIDVNVFKQKKIDDMIFHVKIDSVKNIKFKKKNIQFIMFFNKQFFSTKSQY